MWKWFQSLDRGSMARRRLPRKRSMLPVACEHLTAAVNKAVGPQTRLLKRSYSIHFVIQPMTSSCHMMLLFGESTQWFSSGK